ncbi:hypothetical protein B7494_g3654 [Chlorociboria aeruginascens]|nr:hypothetical protein B7494_g3654 [Chlorociboria aeruginascens]
MSHIQPVAAQGTMSSQGSQQVSYFDKALQSNLTWSKYVNNQRPEFLKKLSQEQHPHILWIGCADSRVPETTILGLNPGDVFVHRNIANIIQANDTNTFAVIDYAVNHLGIQHIVVAGHSMCGGCGAVLAETKVGRMLTSWLAPLHTLKNKHEAELLDPILTTNMLKLAELNVRSGVNTIMNSAIVSQALKEERLLVHGVMYDLSSGVIHKLDA